MASVTKAMALDETLQATNGKMDTVVTKLQGIIDALGVDTSVYKAAGNKACAELLPALLVASNLGNVYNITDNGTTTADFVEGAGKPIHVGDNVAIVDIGTGGQSEYKFDLLAGMVDLTNYVQKSQTAGLLKNDGTVDTKDYAEKVAGATSGNLAGLDGNGNPTDSGWNGAKDTTSISGNPISISGLKANQLAVNPIITLEPIQAGSGTPSPSNVRAISGYDKIEVLSCGKNLLYPTPYSGSYNMAVGSDLKFTNNISTYTQDTDGITIHVPTAWYCRTFATPILKAGTYRYAVNAGDANVRATLYVTDENLIVKQVIYNQQAGGVALQTMTVTDRSRIAVTLTKNAAGDEKYKGIVVTEDDVTPPSPYEHCIKTTSISESLGQTVYWGRWKPRTGEFEVLGGSVDLGTLTWQNDTTTRPADGATIHAHFASFTDCKVIASSVIANMYCSIYAPSTVNKVDYGGGNEVMDAIMGGADNNRRIWIYDSRYNNTSAADFKTAMSGIMLIYELATPFTIQLTPHEISLLKDYAYVSTNGTSIALDYHNGEMASLGDVAQLSESVENQINYLENYIGASNANTAVDMSTTAYKCPCDGYLVVDSGTVTSGSLRIQLLASSASYVVGNVYMNITGAYQAQTTYIKKGMYIRVINDVTGTRKQFIPLY